MQHPKILCAKMRLKRQMYGYYDNMGPKCCGRTNLSINPNKMVIISFTRKRDMKGFKEPVLFNKTIQASSEVKYLGVTLDKGLTWKKQLDKAINKAYRAFWTCRGTFGKTWGLKPKVVYWIYTGVVRPITTYAATI
jgi:hypothetical protein